MKNNLQMLCGLLRAACRETDSSEARDVLLDTCRRVAAMGAVQQFLHTCKANDVEAQHFLEAVCASASISLGKGVTIICDPSAGRLPKEAAMPLALIVNELLTNAAKYGANTEGRVTVKVGLTAHSGLYELHVQDDGPGFNFEKAHKRSSGLGLVAALAQRLNGTFAVEQGLGARCTVRFQDRQGQTAAAQ
jgi:two-component sensor histidine kinase